MALRIAAFEGFYGGSHRKWLDGFQAHSSHQVRIYGLPDRFWKWRMHGGAITLARQFIDSGFDPDLILATDMADLNLLLGLLRARTHRIPVVLYMHENQLTYPWSGDDPDIALGRDFHYAFTNYSSALAADRVLFNSLYHRDAFLNALPDFLNMFPDYQNAETVGQIAAKSDVLTLAADLRALDITSPLERSDAPVILWNHRWEYDKNPDVFFEVLYALRDNNLDFRLIVAGQRTQRYPPVFDDARRRLEAQILHWGFAKNVGEYARLLHLSDIAPVTSRQDFFGISTVEAMYCGAYPLLPGRLALPMHVPESHRAKHIYEDTRDLCNRLEVLLTRGVPHHNASEWVRKYDWTHMIAEYDAAMISIANEMAQ